MFILSCQMKSMSAMWKRVKVSEVKIFAKIFTVYFCLVMHLIMGKNKLKLRCFGVKVHKVYEISFAISRTLPLTLRFFIIIHPLRLCLPRCHHLSTLVFLCSLPHTREFSLQTVWWWWQLRSSTFINGTTIFLTSTFSTTDIFWATFIRRVSEW